MTAYRRTQMCTRLPVLYFTFGLVIWPLVISSQLSPVRHAGWTDSSIEIGVCLSLKLVFSLNGHCACSITNLVAQIHQQNSHRRSCLFLNCTRRVTGDSSGTPHSIDCTFRHFPCHIMIPQIYSGYFEFVFWVSDLDLNWARQRAKHTANQTLDAKYLTAFGFFDSGLKWKVNGFMDWKNYRH